MQRYVFTLFLLWFLAFPASSVAIAQEDESSGEHSYEQDGKQDRKKYRKAVEKENRKSERKGERKGGQKSSFQSDENTPLATVTYDKASDHLSVSAEQASLKSVLRRISRLSGIEVLFDDAADEPLTINIESDSLEDGLKRMLKGSNTVYRYGRNDEDKLLLLGVTLLPVGEHVSNNARRLLSVENEAYHRGLSTPLTLLQQQQLDKTTERWQARLSEMPPARREALEKMVKERQLKQFKRDKRRYELAQRNKKQAELAKAKKLADREKFLQDLSPEQRAEFEARSAQAREKAKAIVLGGQQ